MLLIKYIRYHEDSSCHNEKGVTPWFLKLWVTTLYGRSGGEVTAHLKGSCEVLKKYLKYTVAACTHRFGRSLRFNIDAFGKFGPTPVKCFTNFL
jgi:hypothetical protein